MSPLDPARPAAPAEGPCATDNMLMLRVAEELEYARRILDSLGDAVSAEPILVARHALSLQCIDIIGQLLGHVATIVRSSDPAGVVERIGMGDLKARLTPTKL